VTQKTHHLFCPIAMACEILEPRWTMLILWEMWSGSTRFNEIQRGVPAMSPSLLSKRLKDMETRGLIQRRPNPQRGHFDYLTTALANRLEPLIRQLGQWAYDHVETDISLSNLDAKLLMWNVRRNISTINLPQRKSTIQFILHNSPDATVNYWLVVKPGLETDLCLSDPGYEVDLFLTCDLGAFAAAWMGRSSFRREIDRGAITLIGNQVMADSLTEWLIGAGFGNKTAIDTGLAAE